MDTERCEPFVAARTAPRTTVHGQPRTRVRGWTAVAGQGNKHLSLEGTKIDTGVAGLGQLALAGRDALLAEETSSSLKREIGLFFRINGILIWRKSSEDSFSYLRSQ